MTLQGTFQDGVVVLDPGGPPPPVNGTRVEVVVATDAKPATLADDLAEFLSYSVNLPADAGLNHDHYLYGVPNSSEFDGDSSPTLFERLKNVIGAVDSPDHSPDGSIQHDHFLYRTPKR